jgi:hypothetical protein
LAGRSHVGYEHIGIARDFRRKIAKAEAEWGDAADRLIKPFQRNGTVRRVDIIRLSHAWRKLPGDFAQLGELKVGLEGDTLEIVEARLVTSKLELPRRSWEGRTEEGVGIRLLKMRIAPAMFLGDFLPAADIGLHALARRFQRGRRSGLTALREDFVALAAVYPQVVTAMGDFPVEVEGGVWLTNVMCDDERRPCLVVRTFVARD